MEKISKYGVTLEKYAELIVKTINANEDDKTYKKIIEKEGISLKDWEMAKREWSEEINDPNHKNQTAELFLQIYEAALDNENTNRGPCSLEVFTKIHCELTFRKKNGNSLELLDYETVIQENGLTVNKWELCNSYWIVRVGMPKYRKYFSELVKKYSTNNLNNELGKSNQ
jgi:hypothetical protein